MSQHYLVAPRQWNPAIQMYYLLDMLTASNKRTVEQFWEIRDVTDYFILCLVEFNQLSSWSLTGWKWLIKLENVGVICAYGSDKLCIAIL